MRIAVNARFLIKDKLEGIGRFTYELLKRITENHPEHEFIFFFDRPFDQQFIFSSNVTPVVLFPPARHPFLYIWWFEWSVKNALKKYNIDLFLSTDGYLSLSTKVPTTLVIHDISFMHFPNAMNRIGMWYHKYFSPRFANKASRIAVVSAFTQSDLIKTYVTNPDKIDIVYNAPSLGFKPLNADTIQMVREKYTQGRPYLLYVGAMHPRKNIRNLMLAYESYRNANTDGLPLLIVGRKAWKTEEIENTYHSLTYQQDIIFTNRVSEDALYQITGSARGMVYIPFFEGFGLPIVESMSCGVPVITSNVTSMPEVAGDAAILVSPNNIQEIAQAMSKLQTDDEYWENLATLSLNRSKAFNWDVSAAKLWECMLKSLG
jgi:glycosyltransferase involved in cell wall biosynthesis